MGNSYLLTLQCIHLGIYVCIIFISAFPVSYQLIRSFKRGHLEINQALIQVLRSGFDVGFGIKCAVWKICSWQIITPLFNQVRDQVRQHANQSMRNTLSLQSDSHV